jgi:hypothetical protein
MIAMLRDPSDVLLPAESMVAAMSARLIVQPARNR